MVQTADMPVKQAAALERPVAPAVQASGFLLGLTSDWRVSCVSANLERFLGIDAHDTLGRQVATFFTGDAVHSMRNRVALLRDEDSPERAMQQQLTREGDAFDVSLHLSGGEIVLEAVPVADSAGIDVAGAVGRMSSRLEGQRAIDDLAATATRELRGLTGFDAIQIYRNGSAGPECVASFLRSGLSEFEPANVRPSALRRALWVADGAAECVPILCLKEQSLQSSPCLLAPPDAALADEIRRAGAASAVLLPIGRKDEQWGFAFALHRSPRAPRLARLAAAELFAHILGLRIRAMELPPLRSS